MFWLLMAGACALGLVLNVQSGNGALASACMIGVIGGVALFLANSD